MGQAHRRGVSTYAYVATYLRRYLRKVRKYSTRTCTVQRTSVSEKFYEGTFVLSITSGSHTRTVQLQYCTFVVRKYFRTFESTEVLSYFRTFEGNLACRATVQRCRAYFRKYFRTLQYFRTFEEKIKVHVYVY